MDKISLNGSLLFVCLGNICRSPAAEAVMRKKLANMGPQYSGIRVDSAGIGAWHVGQLPDRRMRATGARHGYDVSSIAQQVCADDFGRYSYIIGMDKENIRDLRRLASEAEAHGAVTADKAALIVCAADFMTRHPRFKTVPDPYYGGESDFELALELIEDACDGIIEELIKQPAN